jgi:UDP-N-acetylmuramyl pentapeptide synthase
MAQNNFFMNDTGIIEIITTGDRTASLIQSSAQKIFDFAAELRKENKPVLILNDISQMGELPPEAHKVFADITRAADYDRFALVGNDNIMRLGANLIAQATGKSEKFKYFDSHDRAIAWLQEFKPGK